MNEIEAMIDRFLDAPVELVSSTRWGAPAVLLVVLDDPPAAYWAVGDRLEAVEMGEA